MRPLLPTLLLPSYPHSSHLPYSSPPTPTPSLLPLLLPFYPYSFPPTPTPPLLPLLLPSYPYSFPPTPTPPLLPLLLPSYPYSSPPTLFFPSYTYSSLLPLLLHSYPYSSLLPLLPSLPSYPYSSPLYILTTSILPIVSSQHSFAHFHFSRFMLSCLYRLPLPLNKTWETSEVQVSETEILTLPDSEMFIILNDIPAKIQVVGQTLVDVMP